MDQWIEVVVRAWICQLYDLECCLGSHTLKWPVGVVFITTNQIVAVGEGCWRWAHRTVSGAPPRRFIVRPWSWSTVGGFVLMWHRTVRCPSDQMLWLLPRSLFCTVHCQSRPLHADSRCSAGAPDSPVNYSGAVPGKPEAEEFELIHPGAPDTVRWCTRHCPVRQTRAHFGFLFAPFFWSLTCSFDWFVLNL
jgi:hypothetical protein